ncbi:MAG: hypothetical protein KF857_00780 [Fimbriimonadaceae bacterium]|nr:hypothetical protein [Fimbriimonadaceae bacterium]
MRLLQRVERAFVSNIVEKTKQLVQSSGPVAIKVAVLRHWAQKQADRAERLEAQSGSAPKRRRLAEIRRRAAGYLSATAKYLTVREEHPMTLRERPRVFSVPDWDEQDESDEKEGEPKFMQFSA